MADVPFHTDEQLLALKVALGGRTWGAADAADLVIAVCRLAAMRFRNVP